MEGESCECLTCVLFFAVVEARGAESALWLRPSSPPPPASHHSSPGVLAISPPPRAGCAHGMNRIEIVLMEMGKTHMMCSACYAVVRARMGLQKEVQSVHSMRKEV